MAFVLHGMCSVCLVPVTCDDIIRNARCVIAQPASIFCPFCYVFHVAPNSESLEELCLSLDAEAKCKNCNNRAAQWWRNKLEAYRLSLAEPGTFTIYNLNNPIETYEFPVDFPPALGRRSEMFRGAPRREQLPPDAIACGCNFCGR